MSFSGVRVAAEQLVNCAVLINMSVTVIHTYIIEINIFRVWHIWHIQSEYIPVDPMKTCNA
jgi:hypothetical protein